MDHVTSIPIESFTVAEKLLLMERLWEDLSKHPSNVAPPDWHGDVLASRLAADFYESQRSGLGSHFNDCLTADIESLLIYAVLDARQDPQTIDAILDSPRTKR